jgi:hypothetical protein
VTSGSGAWTSATTYVMTYTVDDANVDLADVTFDVTGAKDLAGNTQVAATAVSTGSDVDTVNATVTTVALSDVQITDADDGATVTATITFSEAMDQMVAPTVTNNAGTTLTSGSGAWTSATTYVMTYTVDDANVDLADVTFDVTGAKDLAGNTQVAATAVSTGSDVDTVNATVTTVALSDVQITDADDGATVTATITFSEAMDQMVAPTVTNNAGTTLTSGSGAWTSATTYVMTYTVDDANVDLADVTFDVTGAKDLAGNTQVAATAVSTGSDVDTVNATVTTVALSDVQITDADDGATVTATITFSEAMDQMVAPTVTNNAGTTLTSGSGAWTSATTYVMTYTVDDANVDLADVTFDVTGAKDLAGNTQVAATAVSTGSDVDTVNATVTTVALSDVQITDADDGATVTATITFSEAMDQMVAPTVTNNAGTTLTSGSGAWTSATTYVMTYTVDDANVDLADVTFDVTGAKDLAGNTQVAATAVSTGSDVDTVNATVTTVALSDVQITDADDGATVTATITFSEAMDQMVAPTVTNNAGTTLTSGSGAWTSATTYVMTYTVDDANVDLADVTFDVTGAKDLAGNTQVAATAVSTGSDVDTVNATVTTVALSDVQITDADDGATVTATITFSEAMDQMVAPTVTNNAGTTLTSGSGAWTSATTYVMTYTVDDANVDLADVTFDVTGAKDLAGNTQVAATAVSTGSDVDTVNATVTTVALSDVQITDADDGATVTATITFSEAMDQMVAPTVTNNAGTTLTSGSGAWTSATTYVMTYTVDDANVDLADVTFDVTGRQGSGR